MRTILTAAVIAVLAGIIYQKVVEENISMKELAGYVSGTASEMIDEASKAASGKDLKGMEETINSVTESAGAVLHETRDTFIKEKLPEMINIDMQEVWQSITCDKALSMYNDYISSRSAASNSDENIYTMLSLMRKKGQDDKALKETVINLFCDNKN
ncbi:MAG: hypothetical protein K2N11_04935 [Mucispirillum sp.]|nr:hypothetical protein [Mucispirillum sp.]